jgi:hypothetical protein
MYRDRVKPYLRVEDVIMFSLIEIITHFWSGES